MKEKLEAKIRDRIRREGPISFADFMAMALYDPEQGYYASTPIGRDFYTSPSAHPVFGALLAIQLEQVWFLLGQPAPFPLVELGAGWGRLGQDIQDYAPHLSSGFARAVEYISVEKHQGSLPQPPIEGCFLSNEFLDALPTHIVVQAGGRLREVMVAVQGDSLVEVLGEPSSGVAEHLAQALRPDSKDGVILPEGYRTEVNLEAPRWVFRVAQGLKRGVVLTIDYGYLAEELYSPERRRGSLLCYYQHTYNEEPLLRVGCQDITSHVDFTSAIRAGEESGLRCDGLVTQQEFLTNLGIHQFMRALAGLGLPPIEYRANLYAMQELIRPEGLGSFRVLVQSRGLAGAELKGLHGGEVVKPPVMVPLLRAEHLPLYQAKYPQSEQVIDWEPELWEMK